jgi:uncharacterized protein involved in tolerance to divalent cations
VRYQRHSKRLTAEKRTALEAVPGWSWKTREIRNKYSWEEQLAALREYVMVHKVLPRSYHERLGRWINCQRHKKNKLTAEKRAALEAIPGWIWKYIYSWEERLAALREYVMVHKMLPRYRHEHLGLWVSNQRQNKNKLSAEKRAALEAVPGWVWKYKYSWEERLAALREYVMAHKALPRTSHEHLGRWIKCQRRNKNRLTADKRAALEAIPGWAWKQ